MILQLLLYLTIVASSRFSLCDPNQSKEKGSYIEDEDPSNIQDELGSSTILESNVEVNILSSIQPKAVEAFNSSSIKEKAVKVLNSSSIKAKAVEAFNSSSIKEKAVEVLNSSIIQRNDDNMIKSSSIQKSAVEALNSSNIQKNNEKVTKSSSIITKTADVLNTNQIGGEVITSSDHIETDAEKIDSSTMQKRHVEVINSNSIKESDVETKHSSSIHEKSIEVIHSSNVQETLTKAKEVFKCQYGTKTTLDMEHKTICAKGPGEVCGGRDQVYGRCAEGLHCSNCGRCEGCSLLTWICYYDQHCYY